MKFKKQIFLLIFGSLALYSSFIVISDFSIVYKEISEFKVNYLPIIFLLIPIGWLVFFIRWHLLMKNSNLSPPLKENFKVYVAGFALAATPGKIGEFLKCQILKNKFSFPRKTTAPLIIIEHFYSIIGLIIISIVGTLFFQINYFVIVVAILIMIGLYFFVSNEKIFGKLIDILKKRKFFSKFGDSFDQSHDVLKTSIKGRIFVYSSLLSTLYWIIEILTVYFIILSFGIDILSFAKVLSIYSISTLLGMFSFLPLGIGVVEGSLIGFFSFEGIEMSVALTVVVIIRIFTRWSSVIFGFIMLKFFKNDLLSEYD